MKKSPRPLGLEAVEDRLVPSLTWLPNTRFDDRGSAAMRSDPGPDHEHESPFGRDIGVRVPDFTITIRGVGETSSWGVVIFIWSTDRNDPPKSPSASGPRVKTPPTEIS